RAERERPGFPLPLLIGGATTSRQHTAVKIAPEYSRSVVHVLDASRAVDVVSRLLSPTQKDDFEDSNRAQQQQLREQHGAARKRPLLSLVAARAKRPVFDWRRERMAAPSFTGLRLLEDVPLDTLTPFIDWTFFFSAWDLKGRF